MSELENQVKTLHQRIKHHLIALIGKTINEATDEEYYRALSYVLREQVMINWTATQHTHTKTKARKLYYLSMEWLPGRLFCNNIINISQIDLIRSLFVHSGRSFKKILAAEPDPGLGNGGLGRLAACFLDSLATHHYPAMGYGLRFQYGIFEQKLWSGVQIEKPDCWLLNEFPWEIRRDAHAKTIAYSGSCFTSKNLHGEDINSLIDQEDVRAIPYDIPIIGYAHDDNYSALSLRLWTTKESPKNFKIAKFNAGDLSNAVKNNALTDVLYPNDQNSLGLNMRIKQEYLLVSASLQDIILQHIKTFNTMNNFADKVRIQINDTHPALVIAELMHLLTAKHQFRWDHAFEVTQEVCSYTNHTVLKESLEEWDCNFLKSFLPIQYNIIERLNRDFCSMVRKKYPEDVALLDTVSIINNDKVKMAHLAIMGSHRVNGVAKLHSEIIKKEMFKEFSGLFPEKFTNVTNGVTQRRWLLMCNTSLAVFITKKIGNNWITNLYELEKLKLLINDESSLKELIAIKQKNKLRLLDDLSHKRFEKSKDQALVGKELFLDGSALFDVQIKRIHEYKRQLMKALHTIILYQRLKKGKAYSKVKRQIIIGGKAAPGYVMAKNILRLFYVIARKINNDPETTEQLKLTLIENYNVSKAEVLIPATDLSEQISCAGLEASGTSNMKFGMNGALTIGTEDGANIEMREAVTDKWWPFLFGLKSDEIKNLQKTNGYNPQEEAKKDPEVYEALQSLIDGSFAENEIETAVFKEIHSSLLHGENPDRYFIIKDLPAYTKAQDRVEDLYSKPIEWAKHTLMNIAAMGEFSSDASIKRYAKEIWGILPQPIDQEELELVRREFTDSDRCNIA